MVSTLPLGVYQIPDAAGNRRHWGNLDQAALSLVVADAMNNRDTFMMIVVRDSQTAESVSRELEFFLPKTVPVLLFPDWETLVYDSFSPHQDIVSDRLAILNELPAMKRGILVVPASTLMQKLAPRSFTLGSSFVLNKGEEFDIESMRRKLTASAYRCVDTVFEHGEFAVRGAIMDIFPMGVDHPFRIDLFDREIDTIRIFDPETQRSIEQVESIRLLSAREFPLTDDAINRFQDRWHQHFQGDPRNCQVYQDVSQGTSPPGIEYYLPLFFDQLETLFDYLPDDTLILTSDIDDDVRENWQSAESRYESLRYDIQRPIVSPSEFLLPLDEIFSACNLRPRVQIQTVQARASSSKGDNFPFAELPDLSVNERLQNPLSNLSKFLASNDTKLVIVAESNGRREVVDELLRKHHIEPEYEDSWLDSLNSEARIVVTVSPLERGFYLPGSILFITEQQLFGDHVLQQRRRAKQKDNVAELVIKSLTELNIGSPVVHIDHGVGRYLGLETLDIDGQKTEFLTLAYLDEAKLYVPVSSLHLISRYAGTDETIAPLHRLGSETWEKAKRKAAEQVRDVAAELLNIYARREAKPGFAFPAPDEDYYKFAAAFPFEETPDQQNAIERVISDMTQPRAMDHLVCGDVGFGKTEVAMRAAFLAVNAGKQVAVLVPTTLLAQQHAETFRDRFAELSVNVESISRFRTKKEQKLVIEKLEAGTVDIVIGTHALIQDGIKFRDLGLLVIDEEHRFGVRQKEKLKSMRAEVDILTMTATPIPRTLNMAMSGMRDLTIIATPPAKRLSIKTFVRQRNDGLVKEAIQRELNRGGQVYYLHNEVKTIENTAEKLRQIVPNAKVAIGHGQMRERELEQVMSDFYHKRANVLVCSTIIETGIDIPNANTIIMDRADKFGLAQIHQLRGRVGRSHHQAYAYLLTPHPKAVSADASKRLDAISEAEDLGSGFILASHDLEIRGAGELLGDEQTGNMQTIGYSLFMEMLDRAVKAIKDGKTPNLDRPLDDGTEVNLRLPALIPESYLPDVHGRLVLYKRISNACNTEELRELQVEMIDRFGLLPESTKTLFRITALKLRAESLGIKKVDVGEKSGRFEFGQDTPVDPFSIVQLVQSEPHRYRLPTANQLSFEEDMEKPETRFKRVERLLERLEEKVLANTS
ncbi:MAG: transcription-repair coupling factor (superfamily II helicase) [Candidatus Azotimanducaceae bacterium]|jgi:transcription-repair coupling factor (superfamily II helicase)